MIHTQSAPPAPERLAHRDHRIALAAGGLFMALLVVLTGTQTRFRGPGVGSSGFGTDRRGEAHGRTGPGAGTVHDGRSGPARAYGTRRGRTGSHRRDPEPPGLVAGRERRPGRHRPRRRGSLHGSAVAASDRSRPARHLLVGRPQLHARRAVREPERRRRKAQRSGSPSWTAPSSPTWSTSRDMVGTSTTFETVYGQDTTSSRILLQTCEGTASPVASCTEPSPR